MDPHFIVNHAFALALAVCMLYTGYYALCILQKITEWTFTLLKHTWTVVYGLGKVLMGAVILGAVICIITLYQSPKAAFLGEMLSWFYNTTVNTTIWSSPVVKQHASSWWER